MTNLTQEQITNNWLQEKAGIPMVSVWITAFNHEKYISHTLDSILEQKTNFPFEILVHDDSSTDATAEIISKYEKTFPKIIKVFIQKENQWSKGGGGIVKVFNENISGKYIAQCEGDDFWINENRMQEQVDFLEKHTEFYATAARRIRVDEEESIIPYRHYNKDIIITPENVFNMPEMIHLSTIMYRNYLADDKAVKKYDALLKTGMVGDWLLLMFLVDSGDIYVSKKNYSVIRRVLRPGASNFNSIMKFQRNKFIVLKNRFIWDSSFKDFPFERIHYQFSKPKLAAKYLFECLRANKAEKAYSLNLYHKEYFPRMSRAERIRAYLLIWYPIYEQIKEKTIGLIIKKQTKNELGSKQYNLNT